MARQKVRIELRKHAIGAYLKSAEIGRLIEDRANEVAAVANANSMNPGALYEVRTWTGKDRKRADVVTANPEAMKAEARERALTRAAHRFDRGRAR